MPKIRYNFTIDEKTLELAKRLAKQENRTVSNFLETLILSHATKQNPNKKGNK